MSRRLAYWLAGSTTLLLLVACPLRNLGFLDRCFADSGGVMDVPVSEVLLEVRLLTLQVYLPVLGAVGLVMGARASRVARLGGGFAWAFVASGGLLWDKWLGNFRGGELPLHSIYACVLDGRSGHTHSVLTNAPLVLSGLLALWVVWSGLRRQYADRS